MIGPRTDWTRRFIGPENLVSLELSEEASVRFYRLKPTTNPDKPTVTIGLPPILTVKGSLNSPN